MMDAVYCLIPVGALVLMALGTMLNAVMGSVSRRRETVRDARRSRSMKGSFMYRPADEFEPGQPVIEEHVPVPEPEDATSNFVKNWNASKERQQEHARKMAEKRAHLRAACENQRRSEVYVAMKKLYGDLGKEFNYGRYEDLENGS